MNSEIARQSTSKSDDLVKNKLRETSPYFMGEVSTDDTIGREKSIVGLSGVSEVTRSERDQRNLGDPPLGWT